VTPLPAAPAAPTLFAGVVEKGDGRLGPLRLSPANAIPGKHPSTTSAIIAQVVNDELLTLPEIAHTLGMNPSTVRLWVREGRLSAEKVGRKWMVRRADLEQMLADQPHVGHPRGASASAIPEDWSEQPERAMMDLASSAQPLGRIR
jgi:excisionase family DNA binding protein